MTLKKHQRLLWMGIAVVLALVAWRFRPLNETERWAIGRWGLVLNVREGGWNRLELSANRHFVMSWSQDPDLQVTGSWTATDRAIFFTNDVSLRDYFRKSFAQGRPAATPNWQLPISSTSPPRLEDPGTLLHQLWYRLDSDSSDDERARGADAHDPFSSSIE